VLLLFTKALATLKVLVHALHHHKRYMYALRYKKFLLCAITGLSKQDHVLAEPPHRGSVDSVQTNNMSAHKRHQNVLVTIQLICKQHSHVQCTVDLQQSPPFFPSGRVVFNPVCKVFHSHFLVPKLNAFEVVKWFSPYQGFHFDSACVSLVDE
jgi:hypothetical protein